MGRRSPGRRGSSPLSRGIRFADILAAAGGWIIPALAGNTWGKGDPEDLKWDHPRSRGEYPSDTSLASGAVGSSPLSRGILDFWNGLLELSRIIPALAGNTVPEGPC